MKILAIPKNYLEYAQVRGVDPDKILNGIKDIPDFSDETATVNEEDFYSSLRKINSILNDDLWGIKAGNFLALKLLGLIYKLSLSAGNHYWGGFSLFAKLY